MSRVALRLIPALAMALAVMVSSVAAQNNLVLISVSQSSSAWADCRIYQKLAERLTRDARVRVEEIPSQFTDRQRAEALDLDRLIAEGRTRGAQYVLYLSITSERYDRRKTFSVPLVFHKWEVIGVIEGEWRLIDIVRGKQVRAAPIKIEMHGKRVIQATMDDNVDDPDINMSAPAKLQFFSELEDMLADQVFGSIQGQIGKQEREYVTRTSEKK